MSSLPALEVTGASSQEHVVGVPVKAEDGGADGFFDVLAHPPTHMGEKGRRVGDMDSNVPGTQLHQHLNATPGSDVLGSF